MICRTQFGNSEVAWPTSTEQPDRWFKGNGINLAPPRSDHLQEFASKMPCQGLPAVPEETLRKACGSLNGTTSQPLIQQSLKTPAVSPPKTSIHHISTAKQSLPAGPFPHRSSKASIDSRAYNAFEPGGLVDLPVATHPTAERILHSYCSLFWLLSFRSPMPVDSPSMTCNLRLACLFLRL